MRHLVKVVHQFVFGLLLLCLGGIGVLFLTSTAQGIFGIRSFVVLSGSMEPMHPVGSIVVVGKSSAYQPGDVLTFTRGGEIVTHRMVSTRVSDQGENFITKGDANTAVDRETVSRNLVIGKVLFSIPWIGGLIHTLRTPLGAVMLIGVPASLLIGHELWTIKKEYKKVLEKKLQKTFHAEGERVLKRSPMHNLITKG